MPPSKLEIENIFLPRTEKITLELLQKHQNLDPVIRQLKSWHKQKTKQLKADTAIIGNKTLLRYFRKHNNTSINKNTDILENQSPDIKVPCLPLSMMLIAFHTSHSLRTKRQSEAEKKQAQILHIFFNFPNAPVWIKVLRNDCMTCRLNKPHPNQKQIAEKQEFEETKLILQSHNLFRYKRTNIIILRRKLIYNGNSRCIHTLRSTLSSTSL